MGELGRRPLSELATALRERKISATDLTRDVLSEIDANNASFAAYISVYRDEALQRAAAMDQEIRSGHYRGPLHGIPMGIKDNFYHRSHTTTMGSKIHRAFVPAYDATAVEKLAQAGVVFTGKLNLHEYALGVTTENPHYGTVPNPWNKDKIAGGSSGGAGAAIPLGMSVGSIGSDTSGSIRIPAACCGIAGLKPTYGRVSTYGCFPEAWSLDHVGPLARSVTDTALILDAISGYDPRDPGSLDVPPTELAQHLRDDIRGKVIGINDEFFFRDVDDEVAGVVRECIGALQARGAVIKEVTIAHSDAAEYALTIIDTSETSTVHHRNLVERPQDYGEDVRFLLQCGELPSAVDYLEAQQFRRQLRASFRDVFRDVDVLVSPTLPIQTPNIGQKTSHIHGRDVDTVASLMRLVGPANLLGLPAISVPCATLHGMPVGIQFIAGPLQEATVLAFGLAVEDQR